MAGRPKIIKKGGLSHEEKGRITYLLQSLGDSEDTYKTIAKDLDRPLGSITKFIKEMKAIFITPINDNFTTQKSVIKETTLKLIKNGLSEASISNKINRVLIKLNAEQQKAVTADQLVVSCLKLTNEAEFFVKSSANGKAGMTAMTEAAASRADSIDKNFSPPPKNPAIFKLNPDED